MHVMRERLLRAARRWARFALFPEQFLRQPAKPPPHGGVRPPLPAERREPRARHKKPNAARLSPEGLVPNVVSRSLGERYDFSKVVLRE